MRYRGALTILGRRLGELAVLLFAISTLLFFLLRLTGDPAQVLAGDFSTPETVAKIRQLYGLDRPLIEQYGVFLARILRLDFGQSLANAQDALDLVIERLPSTYTLVMIALVANLAVSVPLGAWLGARPDAFARQAASGVVFLLQGVPGFVVGLVLIQIFAVQLRWLPSIGNQGPQSWIMPALTLAAFQAPQAIRVIAANVQESLGEDFIRTARAYGASFRRLVWGHALKNAMLGATALISLQVAFLLSGSLVTEVIFAWPGLGQLMVASVQTLDFPVVQAGVFVVAVSVYLTIAVTDLLFGLIDPRVRRGGA